MTSTNPIRVLVAKPGLDGHDRGAKVIARALRDAGMEVVYTGIRQTPQMIVETAFQEDVSVIGLSILSGAHMELIPQILTGLKERGMEEVMVIIGGIIPNEDQAALLEMGVAGVFGPGASTEEIGTFIKEGIAGARTSVGPPKRSGKSQEKDG
ncbi:MAG: cobalamin B12-binding domain-containing protein [Chloroflexi bacterium]|nr:cobalamin B12-binding domain-containing protein [Chloroflexota bacterium]MCZ6788560.1 cobalamin B12-binding domain-containing protein [Chloroflexota bacterium]